MTHDPLTQPLGPKAARDRVRVVVKRESDLSPALGVLLFWPLPPEQRTHTAGQRARQRGRKRSGSSGSRAKVLLDSGATISVAPHYVHRAPEGI